MKIRFLNDCSFGINPLTFVSTPPQAPRTPPTTTVASTSTRVEKGKENIAVASSSAVPNAESTTKESSKKPTSSSSTTATTSSSRASKPFPESFLKQFLSQINGSDQPKDILVHNFVESMKDKQDVTVTKTACNSKWKELGIKKEKGKMVVPEALLAQHGLRG
ncbi:uncharacterized protein JCM6883_000810 [Sporobolomyces salmoneus]|uniref:uncharacterized protein n=1 Tax=Sporobolomyces salmoneus TaxID=183962 RepID=UPI00317779FA